MHSKRYAGHFTSKPLKVTHVGERRVHLIVIRHAAVETFPAVNYTRPKIVVLRQAGRKKRKVLLCGRMKWYRLALEKNFLRFADGSEQPSRQFTLKVN